VRVSPVFHFTEESMQACVIHRDAHVIVLNKPAGIAVHKGAHAGADMESWFHFLKYDAAQPPSLAHRLDRETSGCLVLGRHKQALKRLGHLFATGQVQKTYIALVVGKLRHENGVVDAPILKSGQGGRWKITVDSAGQQAITHYRIVGEGQGFSVVKLTPKTGRTHQLRVHMAHLGCPILGDPFYGVKSGPFGALETSTQLHAQRVVIPYDSTAPITCEAPLPAHMQWWLSRVGLGGEGDFHAQ
jgi:RluA family pseudouridine synthase